MARRDFSELAVLFAVTGQYDGDARWQDAAAGLARRCSPGRVQRESRHRSDVP